MSANNHGNTPAAWTGVSLAMIGFVVAGIALMLSPWSPVLFWVGIAFWPIAIITWQVMERAGLGAERH